MGKKLLSVYFLGFILLLNSWSGFGQSCPTSVGVTANPGTEICAGEEIIFTANPSSGSGFEYQWQINQTDVPGETSATFTTSSLTNNQKVRVILTSTSDENCVVESSEVPVTVNPVRTATATIAANNSNICPGQTVNFSISSQTNIGSGSQYEWRVNGVSQGTNSTFSSNNLVGGDKVQLWVDSSVPCTAPVLSNIIDITEKPGTPAVPGNISGETTVCPGVTNLVYSISTVTDAASYEWVLPSGWSGTSTSNSITVTSGNTGTATISVRAKNECGNSEFQTINITVQDAAPPQPGAISGATSVCPGVTENYSIAAVSRATEYIWTLPDGTEQVTTDPSITVTTNSSGSNSNISVKARNSCGTSSARSLTVSLKPGKPGTPGAISGNATVCPGVSQTYSIPAVTGATSYVWSFPDDWTGSSTSRSITLTTGNTSGNVTVYAKNDCADGDPQVLAVTVNPGTPAVPEFVDPLTDICPGDTETFSVTEVSGATEYTWTLPSGWSGSSNTNTIQITAGTSGTGSISVQAKNNCGTSAKKTIPVAIKPPAPTMSATIEGEDNVCASSTGFTYTIPAVQYATEYEWSVPGWNITNGQGTRTITVSSGTGNATISVIAKNSCGGSVAATKNVTVTTGVPAQPGTITSSTLGNNLNICPPQEGIKFSVPAVTNATGYNWNLPEGWEITNGANTREITVKVNAAQTYSSPTSISVMATNICGEGPERVLGGIGIDSYILTNAGDDLTVCKSQQLNPITISAEVSFGNKQFDPTFKATGRNNNAGFNVNTNNGKVNGSFTYTYTPVNADITRGYVIISLNVPRPNGTNACGSGSDEMTITFRDIPTASIATPDAICTGTSTNLTITGTPNTKVTFKKGSGSSQTVNLNSSGNATIDSGNLTENTTFQLESIEYLDSPTCAANLSSSAVVAVTQKPTATITYETPYCDSQNTTTGPADLDGEYVYQNGTFTATGNLAEHINADNGEFIPANVTAGTYTVTYTTPASGGCEAVKATTEVTITPLPTATINYDDSPFCTSDSSDQIVSLTGTNAYTSGTYSSTEGLNINANTGVIKADSSTPGTYTVSYTIPAASGCDEVIATTEVTVTEIPVPVISYTTGEICIEDSSNYSPTIEGAGKVTGGTFTAPSGLSITTAGVIDATSSTAGTYKITYTLPEADGCGQITAETEITITPIPSVDITYDGPYCESTSGSKQVAFTNGTGAFENGSFTSSPTGLEINSSSGAITPSASDPGEYTVIYTIPATGGCETKTAETTVSITPVPKATLSYIEAPFCTSDGSAYHPSFTDTIGEYENGTFAGTNGLMIDTNSGQITPAGSTAGTHTVTYTIPTAAGCEAVTTKTDIVIHQEVSINSQPFNIGTCTGEGIKFEVSAAGDGLSYQWFKGTFPGTAISGATSNTYGINTVSTQDDGIYYVEISGTAPCGLVRSDEVTLNVDENIIVDVSPQDENICLNGDVTLYAEASANGGAVTYQWRFNGNDLQGENNAQLNLTNVQSTQAGEYSVFIEGPQGFTCSSIETSAATLTVYEPLVVDAGQDFEVCSTETSISIGDGATAANHSSLVWTTNGSGQVNNATDLSNATYSPVSTDYGKELTFTLTAILEVGGENLCGEVVDTKEVTIIPQPVITEFSYSSQEFCETDINIKSPTLKGEYNFEGGTFAVSPSTGLSIDSSGNIDPSNSSVGSYTITYSTPEGAFCEPVISLPVTVVIGEEPLALFTYNQDVYCKDTRDNSLNADPYVILGEGATAGEFTYQGPGLLDLNSASGDIDLSSSDPGEYIITNTYDLSGDDEDGCVSVQDTYTITITEKPVAEFTYGDLPFCSNDSSPSPTFMNGGEPGVFTAPAGVSIDPSNGKINLAASEAGTHIIMNTIAAADGCDEIVETAEITITALPIAFFEYANSAFCQSGVNPIPNFINGGTGGVFSSATGLEIDSVTGEIELATSTPGTYTVRNSFAEAGGCPEVYEEFEITIDEITIGGDAFVQGTTDKTILVCHQADSESVTPLELVGAVGEVVRWEYSTNSGATWIPVSNISTIQGYEGITETRLYRAIVKSGSCAEIASAAAIVSVIPNQKPSPVSASPGVVCLGTDVNLLSESSFATGRNLASGGTFNNANPEGWLADGCDNCLNSGGSNTKETGFRLSATNGGTYSGVNYTSDNKFAISNGNYNSVMETPVFNLIGIPNGSLEFSHSYKLVGNAEIYIEISTDGGNNYSSILWEQRTPDELTPHQNFHNSPATKMDIDLSPYLGLANLRIRFNYKGSTGSSWAIDNVAIPDAPVDERMEWIDEQTGEIISTTETATVTPMTPGINTYRVTSYINGCRSFGDAGTEIVNVFAYDSFTAEAELATEQNTGCGNNSRQLSAKVISAYIKSQDGTGEITDFSSNDTFTARWIVEGMTEAESNAYFDDATKPDATFTSLNPDAEEENFVLIWRITPKDAEGRAANPCGPSEVKVPIIITNCKNLDFDGVDDFVDLGEGYTGDYSIEAWIRPFERTYEGSSTNASKGTIISTPKLEINMVDLIAAGVTVNNRWYHIAVDSDGKLYVDGINANKTINTTGTERAFIGARWDAPNPDNHFSGWIEEVRIWKNKISEKNIRFTMNQRLKSTGNIGVEVDMEHDDSPDFNNLIGYYQLIATDILNGGYTADLTGTTNGKLRNMESTQENSAPLPYFTKTSYTAPNKGKWDNGDTWARSDVWQIPNTGGIDWNIVRLDNNVHSDRDITVLGLLSKNGIFEMEGVNPTSWTAGGSGNQLAISHYLLIDGIIDLNGESQLLQPEKSIVVQSAGSSGFLDRDQQGTANSFNYNYWSSPVSNGVDDKTYTIGKMMMDGSSASPVGLDFGPTNDYAWADGGETTPRRVSSYWLNKFNGTANDYGSWERITKDTPLKIGEGYTMKGTSGPVAFTNAQNYTFRGIPNNGTIELNISPEKNYLIGNPYPSAIDARRFILDNIQEITSPSGESGKGDANLFDGNLYFWDHFGDKIKSHYLEDYVGGYASLNLIGGVRGISDDERINDTGEEGTKKPEFFIPVGQSFMVNSSNMGTGNYTTKEGKIKFKNSQRKFIKEGTESIFLKPEENIKSSKETDIEKIRISFKSPLGYNRQILVGATPSATSGFDLGYDAPLFDYHKEDMYWLQEDNWLVIQGVENFNKDQVLPLGIAIDKEEEFTIKLDELENISDTKAIYLHDILNDTVHNLRKSPYVSSSEPGYIHDRFEIIFYYEEELPVDPGGGDGDIVDAIELNVKHGHNLREIQILNPDQIPLNDLHLFDVKGNLITTYRNVSHEKEVRLPVKSYSSGVYIIKLYGENTVITKKIIISN